MNLTPNEQCDILNDMVKTLIPEIDLEFYPDSGCLACSAHLPIRTIISLAPEEIVYNTDKYMRDLLIKRCSSAILDSIESATELLRTITLTRSDNPGRPLDESRQDGHNKTDNQT
jgi:hypothetical protein